jgi:hypothetical protein
MLKNFNPKQIKTSGNGGAWVSPAGGMQGPTGIGLVAVLLKVPIMNKQCNVTKQMDRKKTGAT